MSLPTSEFQYAGIWNVSKLYNYLQFVESPTDNLCYVYVGLPVFSGGGDPATIQPSPIWIPINPPTAGFTPAYGSFSSTATQNLTASVELPLTYNTIDVPPIGVFYGVPNASSIGVNATGMYKVVSSLQCNKLAGGGTTADIEMYPKINGTAVPNSATRLQINNATESVMTVEWFLPLAVGNVLQIALYTTSTNAQALAFPANPPVPAIPSIITTITRIA